MTDTRYVSDDSDEWTARSGKKYHIFSGCLKLDHATGVREASDAEIERLDVCTECQRAIDEDGEAGGSSPHYRAVIRYLSEGSS